MLEFLHNIDYRVWVFIIGLATAACCSLLSTYVVLRRMSLISEGVAHAGFGGIGVALVAGYFFSFGYASIVERLITGVFCLLTALAIGFFTRSKKVHDDSAIGIFLVATMALGYMLIRTRVKFLATPGMFVPDVESLLFGDFLAVGWTDAALAVAAAVICFAVIALFFHEFLYTTLDEEMARVNGVPTRFVNTMMLVLVTLVIVIGSRMIGALMITAMTIIPGATAAMLSRKFTGVLLASLLVGVGGTLIALLLAFTLLTKFVPGPILVLTLFAIFCTVWTLRHLFKPKVQSLPEDSTPAHSHAGHHH